MTPETRFGGQWVQYSLRRWTVFGTLSLATLPMRRRQPDTSRMAYSAFELFDRDVDLRPLPLSEGQRHLATLCDKGRKAVPCLAPRRVIPRGRVASRVVRALSARGHRFEAIVLEVLERYMP